MKDKNLLGGILATVSALIGIIGHFVLFLNWYHIGMEAESAEPGCEILLKYIHPALADLGIFAGILFAVSAYGFFTKKGWAFLLSVTGLVLALLGSWFINVPYMAAGLPPVPGLALERTVRPWALARDIRALRRLIVDRQLDVVHAHLTHDHWLAALAVWFGRVGGIYLRPRIDGKPG